MVNKLVRRCSTLFFQHAKKKNKAGLSESFATYPLPFWTTGQQQDNTRNNPLNTACTIKERPFFFQFRTKITLFFQAN